MAIFKFRYFFEFSLEQYNSNESIQFNMNNTTYTVNPRSGTIVSIQQKQESDGNSLAYLIIGFNDNEIAKITTHQ